MTQQLQSGSEIAGAGLDDALIGRVVDTFYARARQDDLIGPIFNGAVPHWDEHIANITDFWSSMLLKTGRYNGRPLRPHLMLPLKPEHFDRWLALFETTVRELCSAEIAEAFMVRARRIADSFEMQIGAQHGQIVGPRHSVPTLRRQLAADLAPGLAATNRPDASLDAK